jgi:hypothetical protein
MFSVFVSGHAYTALQNIIEAGVFSLVLRDNETLIDINFFQNTLHNGEWKLFLLHWITQKKNYIY